MMNPIVIGTSTGVDLLYRQLSELDVRPDFSQKIGENLVIEPSAGGHAGSIANAITVIDACAATTAVAYPLVSFAATRSIASRLRSTSSSVVAHDETLMRIAR